MKAYLIDPFERKVTEVEHSNDLLEYYELLHCTCIDWVRTSSNGDGIYVDDEGLMKPQDKQAHFVWLGYDNVLAGRGLYIGGDMKTGETCDPIATLEYVKRHIAWITYNDPFIELKGTADE